MSFLTSKVFNFALTRTHERPLRKYQRQEWPEEKKDAKDVETTAFAPRVAEEETDPPTKHAAAQAAPDQAAYAVAEIVANADSADCD